MARKWCKTPAQANIDRYGTDFGPKLFRVLKANAANARRKAFYRQRAGPSS
jgi:hypothetical protein